MYFYHENCKIDSLIKFDGCENDNKLCLWFALNVKEEHKKKVVSKAEYGIGKLLICW